MVRRAEAKIDVGESNEPFLGRGPSNLTRVNILHIVLYTDVIDHVGRDAARTSPEGRKSRTIFLAVGHNSTACRGEQQRNHATPMIFVHLKHNSVVNCNFRDKKVTKTWRKRIQELSVVCANWQLCCNRVERPIGQSWLWQTCPGLLAWTSRISYSPVYIPYFLLFVLCLSTCRCSLIAAFFLPVIGNELFPSSRPFLFAPLRFLRVRTRDGEDEPNK